MNPAALPTAVSRAIRITPLPSHASPQLSIVIVNYRQWCNTARLTRQLLASESSRRGAAEVVIVDNHSPVHFVRRRLRRMPGVSMRCFAQNRGFARGVNEGCRLSRGDWFLLLNPDVSMSPGQLDGVLEHAEQIRAGDPKAGVIGFQLRHADGSRQGSVGKFPTLCRALIGLLRPRAERRCPSPLSRERGKVAWVSGCGLLVHRDCWRQLGGFDPRFFLYYEDVDFCRRARAAGWSVWFEPALRLIHARPLHTREVRARLRLLTRHALLSYAEKHWPAWEFRAVTAMVWLEAVVRERRSRQRDSELSARLFRRLRGLATDFWCGRSDRAYRRAWRTGQIQNPVAPKSPIPNLNLELTAARLQNLRTAC